MGKDAKHALAAFTYGERLKSLVLVAQVLLDGLPGTPEKELEGAKRMVYLYLKAAANEAQVAFAVTREPSFSRLAEELHFARGALALKHDEDAADALNRALVKATTVSQRAAEILVGEGLL